MKKIILASLVVILSGCSSYQVRNEALTGQEYQSLNSYCHADRQGSVVWENNVPRCDNGSRTYIVPKQIYKDSSPSILH